MFAHRNLRVRYPLYAIYKIILNWGQNYDSIVIFCKVCLTISGLKQFVLSFKLLESSLCQNIKKLHVPANLSLYNNVYSVCLNLAFQEDSSSKEKGLS